MSPVQHNALPSLAILAPGPVRFARLLRSFALLLIALAVPATVGACEGTSHAGRSRATGPASSASQQTVSGAELTQKGGGCPEQRRVSQPAVSSAEWPIWRAYQLALGPDDAAAFTAFVGLFPAERSAQELRELYWPRLRANVHKYVAEAGKPDFTICRSVQDERGRKFFIATQAAQMPPPITVGEVDGQQKIVFLTPF